MVVDEIWHAMFAAGLVRADELIVDVVGLDCFVVSLTVLDFPCDVVDPFVIGLLWWEDLEHAEASEETLTLGGG
jgi:hypothetical protein